MFGPRRRPAFLVKPAGRHAGGLLDHAGDLLAHVPGTSLVGGEQPRDVGLAAVDDSGEARCSALVALVDELPQPAAARVLEHARH